METPDSAPFSTVTRERCARNKGSGRETPGLKESFQKENRSGVLFLPHPRNLGATNRPLWHHVAAKPPGSPPSPPPQTRAQKHAHTHIHTHSRHRPSPRPAPPCSPPASARKRDRPAPEEQRERRTRSPHSQTVFPRPRPSRRQLRLLPANSGCRSGSPPPRLPGCCTRLAPDSSSQTAASAPPTPPPLPIY